MIINNIADLKLAAKNHSIKCYVQDNPDLGIFQIRYDIRSNRFIVVNTSRQWSLGIKDRELFEGNVEKARAIGKALLSNKLIIIEGELHKDE